MTNKSSRCNYRTGRYCYVRLIGKLGQYEFTQCISAAIPCLFGEKPLFFKSHFEIVAVSALANCFYFLFFYKKYCEHFETKKINNAKHFSDSIQENDEEWIPCQRKWKYTWIQQHQRYFERSCRMETYEIHKIQSIQLETYINCQTFSEDMGFLIKYSHNLLA